MFSQHYTRHQAKIWAELARRARERPDLKRLYTRGADPRVARLVQATALGAAAASARLDDGNQVVARAVAAPAIPECLRPRPGIAVVQFDPARSTTRHAQGLVVPAKVGDLDVHFEVRWPVQMGPYALAEARIDQVDSMHQVFHLAVTSVAGSDLGAQLPDRLRLFFNIEPALAVDILHALRASHEPVRATAFNHDGEQLAQQDLPASIFEWVRIDTTEPPLIGGPQDRFGSGTLLRDYFDAEETFAFADLLLRGTRAKGMARLELTLPLARQVEGATRLSRDDVRLFCSPATNQYQGRLVPIQASPDDEEWVLSVARRPHAEILHLHGLTVDPYDGGPRQRVAAWETADDAELAMTLGPYYQLAQVPAASEPRTVLRVTFSDAEAFSTPAPEGILHGDVLASDGALVASLKVGDIAVHAEGIANVTRVTPSRRAVLDKELPIRLAAYARQGPDLLATKEALTEFVSLHDGYALAEMEEGSRLHVPTILRVSHTHVHQRDGSIARFGDRFVVTVHAGQCRPGEVWAVGELIARAFSERTDKARFSEVVLETEQGDVIFPPFSRRTGNCLSFPFG